MLPILNSDQVIVEAATVAETVGTNPMSYSTV
jgi:hypothetical protein